jgi:hypothetical protein
MVANGDIKLIDYDGMFVPGMRPGNGSETGHKHFQHPDRRVSDFGPKMDRFSFIALDLSLKAVIEDKSLYAKFREGGETVVFKANDFTDPGNSEIFRRRRPVSDLQASRQHHRHAIALHPRIRRPQWRLPPRRSRRVPGRAARAPLAATSPLAGARQLSPRPLFSKEPNRTACWLGFCGGYDNRAVVALIIVLLRRIYV